MYFAGNGHVSKEEFLNRWQQVSHLIVHNFLRLSTFSPNTLKFINSYSLVAQKITEMSLINFQGVPCLISVGDHLLTVYENVVLLC